jgi:hypothetical protein
MVRGGRLEYQKLDQLARARLKVLWLADSIPEGLTELPQYDYRNVGRRRTIVEVGRMVLDNGNPWYLGLVRFLPSTSYQYYTNYVLLAHSASRGASMSE